MPPVAPKPAAPAPKPVPPVRTPAAAPPKAAPSGAEPAGAARFTAVSYPNAPVVGTPVAPLTLEARVAALEAVVHAIAPYSRNAEHGGVAAWIKSAGARIKADAAKVKKAL